MILSVVVALVLLHLSKSHAQEDLIVQVSEGTLLGHVLQSWNGSDYYAYQDIPYAAPPTGINRYKVARDPIEWHGVKNATSNRKRCIQFDLTASQRSYLRDVGVESSEDCLYLNVYTPVKPRTGDTLLPVLVYIHGGGYFAGSGVFTDNGPKYLMDHGIIVATVNYRLGALGFLSTGDGAIPGNIGLKDQSRALHWIRANIKAFGGDPEKITIAGESAGAYSTSYQLLAKANNGTFRGAIQQSGSALCRGSFNYNARHYAFELGRLLDPSFVSNSSDDLLRLLQEADVLEIAQAADQVVSIEDDSNGYVADTIWSAVIEDEDAEDALITAPQMTDFLNGNWNRVPLLMGFTSEEAVYFKAITGGSRDYLASAYDANPSLLVPRKLEIFTEWHHQVGTDLKTIYTSRNFSDDNGAFTRLSSDAAFTNGILKQAELASEYVPVYLYEFSYEGQLGLRYYPTGVRPEVNGAEKVGHSEDLSYLWEFGWYRNQNLNTTEDTDDVTDETVVRRMVKLWTNFVKYQDPTPSLDEFLQNVKWPTVTGQVLQYLDINRTLEIKDNPRYFYQVNELLWRFMNGPYYVY